MLPNYYFMDISDVQKGHVPLVNSCTNSSYQNPTSKAPTLITTRA